MLKNLPTEKLELILTILSVILILAIPQYGVILSFIIVIAYLRRSQNRKEVLKSIGLSQTKNVIALIIVSAILGGLIELTMEIGFNPLIEKITHSKIDLSEVKLTSIADYLMWIVIGFLLGGLLEEILFRGFLITRISKILNVNKISDILAVLITSCLFGLCHLYQGWSGVISTGIIGFIFGIIFLSFNKNLWYCILTHGFVNLTALTILYAGYYEKLSSLIF
ncbi:MAG: CPBP family intramembrane glutamic endopeptidase [Bacteroidia bacterium]